MHSTHAKLAEDANTAYTLSASDIRKLAIFGNLAFSLQIIIFVVLRFTLKPFDSNAPLLSFSPPQLIH